MTAIQPPSVWSKRTKALRASAGNYKLELFKCLKFDTHKTDNILANS